MAKKYIDAERLVEYFGDWYTEEGTELGFVGPIKDLVFRMPAADIEPRWIPVTEQLPEEDKEVLISYRYKEGEGDTSHVNIDITTYGQMYFGGRRIEGVKHWRAPFEYFENNYEVIAWMPLPEPYKGGEQNE